MEELSYYKKPIEYECPICGATYFSYYIYKTKREKTCYPCRFKAVDAEKDIIIMNIDDIYVGYPEGLYSSEDIKKDQYLSQMAKDVKKLPPVQVIKLSDNEFSLSNGYHRFSIFKYLNYTKIRCEVL